jgi:hypothetical protein
MFAVSQLEALYDPVQAHDGHQVFEGDILRIDLEAMIADGSGVCQQSLIFTIF